MMNSSFGTDDDFAPNPFRSSNDNDWLVGSAAPMQQQHHHHQQPLYASNQPDPQSGMMGTFDLPAPPPQAQPLFQQPYLSGTMDRRVNLQGSSPNNNSNNNNNPNNYKSTDEIASTPWGWWRRCTNCVRIEGYQPYFDVDTTDIAHRLYAALTLFYQPDQFRTAVLGDDSAASTSNANNNNNNNNSSGSSDLKGPDLYGPLWISMTLIFVLASTSNLSKALHFHAAASAATSTTNTTATTATNDVQAFDYDMYLLVRASTVLLWFAAILPSLLWMASSCLGMPLAWVLWMCCYGYSLTPYLVACAIAWIPLPLVNWIVLGLATGASVLLVVRNMSTPLLNYDATKAAPIIMSILGTHALFLFVLKFGFYSFK